MNTKPRSAAAALAVLAVLTLAVAAPVTADAKIKDGVIQVAKVHGVVGQPEALVAPGQPPTPCTPGRWKCPLGTGTL